MPRQNRVSPNGDIFATTARGTLMGNRGCLHNGQGQIRRLYQTKRWIICRLSFKDRQRVVMTPGRYTELFFLDEATALAAGHRPCAECKRARYNTFRSIWRQANAGRLPDGSVTADSLDAALHQERITIDKKKVTYTAQIDNLPDGTIVTLSQSEQPHLVWGRKLFGWSPAGYDPPQTRLTEVVVQVLTPRSVVNVLAGGYDVGIHPSAQLV